jgi:hypothetical protein
VVKIVPDRKICSSFYEQLRDGKASVLCRHVERSHALAVGEATEGGFAIEIGPVIDEPLGRFHSVAHRGPDKRRPPIWIGIQARRTSKSAGGAALSADGTRPAHV